MFFFCQAEDGIRDGHVTGVQTCALPIFTQIPWYYLAAIDQFERNIETDLSEDQVISIQIPDDQWFGPGNSSKLMHNEMIALFDGIGQDSNGDGQADPEDAEDVLYTMANKLLTQGQTADDIKIALFNYYDRDLTVRSEERR